jgi:hypothetical protein
MLLKNILKNKSSHFIEISIQPKNFRYNTNLFL